jgi:metal-responsive CopG/Arc/MetJ family transcriptional regulator
VSVLKKDIKRVTLSMPKNFLDEFNKHLKNFALTERSLWIIDAMREKMSKEKQMLAENDKET